MVRQAHHDRLDLPLVLSSVEGLRSSRLTGRRNRPKLASLYWICRRSDKGRGHDRIKAVIVNTCSCSWFVGAGRTAFSGPSEEPSVAIGAG
jgi:hypothetical protein